MKDSYSKSYSNPFSGVNAVQLDIDSILEYWCNPFLYELFSGIKEDDIYNETMNIVFMGGRSTGKSMFLRYWSYPVQFKSSINNKIKLADNIQTNKGIGFYFRIDGPVLRSFQGKGITDEHWSSIFTHYFELIVGREYLEAIHILCNEDDQLLKSVEKDFSPKVCQLMGLTRSLTVNELIEEFDLLIKEVDTYRGNVAFTKKEFAPKGNGFPSQMLSFGIPEIMTKNIDLFKSNSIILLLDEYENFVEYQQIVINTLLRFSKPNIKFRIGMRLEGFRTFTMMADEDFIKEGREYRKVIFEEILNKSIGYHDFLKEICRKRLESIPLLHQKEFTDITKILSDRENLEEEALDIVKGSPEKVLNYFKNKISKTDLDTIRYPQNPLIELLNCIWLLRGTSAIKVQNSMNDYLNGIKSDDGKKYHRDYVDKYKLSLVFLLCSIYHKNKQYYSFNTFSFLSSGIVGHFIELCRRSFAIADWGDDEKLLDEGLISKEHQSKAAIDFSFSEKQQINRVERYGGHISRFINNMGNIFRAYHLDFKMRYPETNQFAINIHAIRDAEIKEAMKSAIKWSVIQGKPKMQKTAPSENLQDTYTINRIFSPNFQISYRTRGGKSIRLTEKILTSLMNDEKINISDFIILDDGSVNGEINDQPDLFSNR